MKTVHDTVDTYTRTRKVPVVTGHDDNGKPEVEVTEVLRTFCTTPHRTSLSRGQVDALNKRIRIQTRKGRGGRK